MTKNLKLKCPKCETDDVSFYIVKHPRYEGEFYYNVNCNNFTCANFRQYRDIKDLKIEWNK